MPIADINVRIGAKIDGLIKNLSKSEAQLKRSARRFSAIGDSINKNITLPFIAATGASTKFVFDLEKSTNKIENLVGISGRELDKLKSGIDQLSGPLGKTKAELSDALFVVTSAGARGAQSLEILEQAGKASAQGLGETADIARTVTAAVTAYKDSNLEASKATDILFATVRAGNLEAAELAPALGKVLPIASALGVSFEEVGANIATFTRLGVSAKESVTGLRSLLSNILKPTNKTAAALESVGLSVDEVRKSIKEKGLSATLQDLIAKFKGNTSALAEVFPNVEGLANALGTAGAQGKEYTKVADEISKSTGLVNKGFENTSEKGFFKFQQALVKAQNTLIDFGNIMIPVVTKEIDIVNAFLNRINALDPVTKKALAGVTGLAAGFGVLAKTIGTVKQLQATYIGIKKEALTAFKNLTGKVLASAQAFKALSMAQKATIAGAVIAGVTALIVAWKSYSDQTNDAAQKAEVLRKAQEGIAVSSAREQREADKLIGVLRNETASREDKVKALDQLQATYPAIFSSYDIEKGSLAELDILQRQLNDSILKGVIARKKEAAISSILDEIIQKQLRLKEVQGGADITGQEKVSAGGGGGPSLLSDEDFRSSVIGNIQSSIENLEAQVEETSTAFDGMFESISGNAPQASGLAKGISEAYAAARANIISTTSSLGESSTAIDITKGSADAATMSMKKLKESLPKRDVVEPIEALSSKFTELKSSLEIPEEVQEGMANLTEHLGMFDTLSEKVGFLKDKLAELHEQGLQNTESFRQMQGEMAKLKFAGALAKVFKHMGDAMMNMAAKGETSFRKLAAAAVSAGLRTIRIIIMKGVAKAVEKQLGSGPWGVFTAAAAGAAAGAIFTAALKAIKVPSFADGGIISAPMLAMVGDNPISPEVVAPLHELQNMISGGAASFKIGLGIRGDELIPFIEQEQEKLNRQRGY